MFLVLVFFFGGGHFFPAQEIKTAFFQQWSREIKDALFQQWSQEIKDALFQQWSQEIKMPCEAKFGILKYQWKSVLLVKNYCAFCFCVFFCN